MKKGTTLFLKLALFIIGTPVFALVIIGLPWIANNPANPDYDHLLYPILIGFYIAVIPFFVALYQAFLLLSYIDKNEAFSDLSVMALKKIKISAIMFCSVFIVILPFVFLLAELDDAPGLVIVGGLPIFASMVIAVFAAVLQKLLREAIDIKSENDLTV